MLTKAPLVGPDHAQKAETMAAAKGSTVRGLPLRTRHPLAGEQSGLCPEIYSAWGHSITVALDKH